MAPRYNPENIDRHARSGTLVAVLACLAIMVAAPSQAQQRISTPRGSNVTIDYGVLDSLGPAPNVPRVLRPSMPRPRNPLGSAATRRLPAGRAVVTGQRIVLTPPGRAKAKRLTKRSRPARRQITKSKQAVRAPLRKPAQLRPKSPPARKFASPRKQPRKVATRRPIPPPPISTTPLEPVGSKSRSASMVPPAPKTRDRIPPPPTAGKIASTPPTARMRVTPNPTPVAAPPPRTAALTPAREGFGVGRSYRLAFASGLSKLDGASTSLLDEIAGGAKSDNSIRLKLLAYAGAAGQTASQSRRLSLSRALAVRSYLIDKGVRSVQFEVQAKGKKLEGGPPDRVDVIVTKR